MQSPDVPPTEIQRGAGYETRDVDPKVIGWLVAGIILLVAGSMVGLRLMVTGEPATREDPSGELAVDQTPPEPRLQNTPARDYEAFVAAQEQELDSYGWVDREQGTVRIPVERAMDLAVEKGLAFPAKKP